MTAHRVVVTGMGALTPIGNSLNEYWNGLVTGKSGAAPITKFDTTHFKTTFGCELKNLSLEDHFDLRFIRKHDLLSLYALIAAREAIKNSGVLAVQLDLTRCGVIWGSGNGGITTIENEILEFANDISLPRFSPYFVPKSLADTPSGAIALEVGFQGINYSTVSACASATSAIMDAYKYIKWGEANVMICGGSEAPITRSLLGGFSSMKALSRQNDSPETASKPLDVNRDGFVIGEGAGALVLESLEHAQARGATILAEVVGTGMSNDAFHSTATHPAGEGAKLAMQSALSEANISMNEIDYINLHATATPLGDLSEIRAISALMDESAEVMVSATKSMTGHLLGAAGAIEAIASVKALVHGIIPPTINSRDLEEEIPANMKVILENPVKKNFTYAISNTFGFGGHNAIALFKKWAG